MFRKIKILIILILLASGSSFELIAQDLIKVIQGEVTLNQEQQKYKDALLRNTEITKYQFVEINTNSLELENDQVFQINIPNELSTSITRDKSYHVSGGRLVWIGRSADMEGFVRFVVHNDIVNAKINLIGYGYCIFPLTDGLHLMFKDEDANQGECNEDGFQQRREPDPNYDSGDPGSPANNNQRSAVGECSLRMMVVFTQAVKTASADVTTLVEGHVADWNIYNSNSNVDYTVELARCIGTDYVATGNAQNHPTYGNDSEDMIRLYEPLDGFMDEMHTIRNQYDADQVSLFVTTLHSGGGEALPIGAVASDAFHTMLWNNGAYTFAHESGHLFGQRHSHDNTNTPYAYGHGRHVSGTPAFATVMAYTSQCSPCSRIPNWSNPNINSSGVATGTVAFSDCARVQREQDQTQAAFQLTVSNKLQFTNDTISDEEQADLLGNNYIETDLKTVLIENGGSATYRAANHIKLEPGFHAKAGSVFRAFLDNCTAMNITGGPSTVSKDDDGTMGSSFNWSVFPNPLSDYTVIEFNLPEEQEIKMVLYDMQGKLLQTIYDNALLVEGKHSYELDAQRYQPGMYLLYLNGNKLNNSKRIVIQR